MHLYLHKIVRLNNFKYFLLFRTAQFHFSIFKMTVKHFTLGYNLKQIKKKRISDKFDIIIGLFILKGKRMRN